MGDLAGALRVLLAVMMLMLMLPRTERLSRRRRAFCLLACMSYLSLPIDPRIVLLRLHKRVVSR